MKKNTEFYLVEELAEKLRVSNMTIYRYISGGKLSAYKIGKEYRIAAVDYENFLKNTKIN